MHGIMSEHVQCVICIHTLRQPIRMLDCGHNFCHICLVSLSAAYEDKRCPICRRSIKIEQENVNNLPRNHTLEDVIQKLEEVESSMARAEGLESPLAGDAIQQLKDLGALCQRQRNYQRAAEIFQVVIGQSEGWDKLQACLKQTECYLDLGQTKKARLVCHQLVCVVDSSTYFPSSNQTCQTCDEHVNNIALKFINNKAYDSAIYLARCRYLVIKHLTEEEKKLGKLESVGWLMTQICKRMSYENKDKYWNQQYSLMEEIVDFMQTSTGVDVKIKCKQVAWFLGRFGYCCNQMKDWDKSISLNEQAITLMKTAYSVEASQCRVFGSCHSNLGVALHNVGKLIQARNAHKEAAGIYCIAWDWPSEERKLKCISKSTKYLEKVTKRIARRNDKS